MSIHRTATEKVSKSNEDAFTRMSSNEQDVEALRQVCEHLYAIVDDLEQINRGELRDRRLSLALTHIETGAMWLDKYIAQLDR